MKKYICLLSLFCLQVLINVWANEMTVSQIGKQSEVKTFFEDLCRGTRCASKAYINHGIKPVGKKYCFAVVPGATSQRMSSLS